jgi:rubrerythrin
MQKSTQATRLGANRTGLQASPQLSKQMSETIDSLPVQESDIAHFAEMRMEYIREADPLGSIPGPGTLKGAAKSGAKMMTGARPHAFIDKLAERLAFERGGARLYDAVIAKFQTHGKDLKGVQLSEVEDIRREEVEHALLIKECIEKLGADPTAQTPSADLVGVETMGLLQAASDPRTSLAQTLHAALSAELTDYAGWETLIALADNMGQKDMVERFRTALAQEDEHLRKVRSWYNALTLESGELM